MTNHCDDDNSDLEPPATPGAWTSTATSTVHARSTATRARARRAPATSSPDRRSFSEPESQNAAWVIDENPNIRFSMNIHTHGGYFMWAPGSYRNPGRVPAPRPSSGSRTSSSTHPRRSSVASPSTAARSSSRVAPARSSTSCTRRPATRPTTFCYRGLGRGPSDLRLELRGRRRTSTPATGTWQGRRRVLPRLHRGGVRPGDGVRQRHLRDARGRA